jgi:uncharacterized membrane protein YdbT with pleckstrin-like domain
LRTHPLQLFNRVFSLALFLAALIYFSIRIFSYDISLNNRYLYFQAPIFMLLSVVTLSYIVYLIGSYLTTRITIEREYIIYESSFFIKKKVTLSYKNIHNYTVKRSIIHKTVGAKRLLINSGSHLESAEIDIIMDEKIVSLIVRNIDRCNKSCEKKQNSVQIENKWLLLFSILIPSKWLSFTGYALSILTVAALAINQNRDLSYTYLLLIYLGAVLLSIVINSVFILNKYYNFTLQRFSNTLAICHGFTSHINRFVLNDKINGVLIKQNFLNKLTRTYHPFIYAAGYKNINEEFSFPLFPITHKKAMQELIKDFLPNFFIEEKSSVPPEKAKKNYLVYPMVNYNLIALPICLLFFWVGEYLAIPVYLFFNSVLFTQRQLAYKNSYIFQEKDILIAQKGGLMTKKIYCRLSSLQAIRYKNTIYNQKKNIKKIKLFIKSVKNKAFSLGYLQDVDILLL